MFIKSLILILFFSLMVGVGIYCRRHTSDVNGFVLGGRSVGPWLTAFAYGTSYFSAVIFVGYAGQFGWKFGLASTWVGLGNAFIGSLLAWSILGRRTRLMTQHLDSATMPDFFGKRFNSRNLKIAASVIIMLGLTWFTTRTRTGKAMRAVSEDMDAARLMGINVNSTISFTFAVGSALAGIGSVLYCCSYPQATPTMGSMLGLKAFVAAVLGGIGSIPGAMVGGIAIGLCECFVSAIGLSAWKDAVTFAILIIVLLVKPTGFLGRKVQEKV